MSSKLVTALQMWSRKSWEQRSVVSDAVGPLCCKSTLLAHGQLVLHQSPHAPFKMIVSLLVLKAWDFPHQEYFSTLNFIKLLSALFSSPSRSLIRDVSSSDVSTTPSSFVSSGQVLRVLTILIIQVTHEDVKYCWSQNQCLGHITDHWLSVAFHTAGHSQLRLAIWSLLSPPPHCPLTLSLLHQFVCENSKENSV